jgi:hypothetical protein
MTIEEIANRLVVLCRQGKFETAQQELYSKDITSTEPQAREAFQKVTKGLPAVLEKGKKFEEMTETMHHIEVSEPIIAGNAFACTLRMEMTMKGQGHMDMTELCVYEVKDGKVTAETFYV